MTSINHLTIGPPGTGKTTWLSRQIEKAHDKGHNITVISLTKSSAAEVAGRDLPIPDRQVGTLHSQCFRALRGAQIAQAKKHADDWNAKHPHFSITPVGEEAEETATEPDATLEGDKLLNEYSIARGRMTPRESWPENVTAFADLWEEWKREQDVLDFTDLIVAAINDIDSAPGQPDILMIDEAQDMDRLEMTLAQKWGHSAGNIVIVGDPDQCQPPGTILSTAQGPVPIEDFQPSVHTLITWNPGRDRVEDQPKGFPIKAADRRYTGDLIAISAGGNHTRCTPDHIWYARLTNPWAPIVWLSSQGERWTAHTDIAEFLGVSKNNPTAGVRHPAHRTWPLRLEPDLKSSQLTAAKLNAQIAAHTPIPCILARFGRDPATPMMTEYNSRTWLKARHVPVRASNLLTKIMSLPALQPDSSVRWTPIAKLGRQPYDGVVHSFHIEPHKTYVADGILTHNCLYEWRGSDPATLRHENMPEHTRSVLKQSYRLSQAVHRKALRWIDSCPNRDLVEYLPTDDKGQVRYLPLKYTQPQEILHDAQQYLDDGLTVMLTTTCAYMLDDLITEMRQSALPFHNPLRTRAANWNPLAIRASGTSTTQRILDFLHMSEYGYWNADQLRSWAGAVRLKQTFAGGRGIAKRLEELIDDDTSSDNEPCLSWDTIYNLLPEDAIDAALTGNVAWLRERLNKARQNPARFPMEVIRRHGPESLRQEPQLIPGTINSHKGGEADVVYLFPDLSQAGTEQWFGSQRDRAAIYRLFYVGMTRARNTLVICEPVRPDQGPEFWMGD